MAKIQSVFGAYATQLQVVVDSSLSRFAPTWYQKYFGWAPTQNTLNFTSVVGASRIEAAASVVNRSSPSPLRSRPDLALYQGNIEAIKEKFVMREDDYRNYLAIQSMNVDDAIKKNQTLELMFGDLLKAGNSAHKRLDIYALQAVSTGKISLNIDNNPDGIVLKNDLDLLMPSGNKKQAAVKWATSATATPLTDITNVVLDAKSKGRGFAKILMSYTAFLAMAKAKEVIDSLVSFNQLQKGAAIATLDKVNEYLTANLLPVIEIVDEVIGVEKDGVISPIRPFSDANISFIPSGQLGMIKNALCIEQMMPVEKVNYATYNHALLSKYSENDPWAEFTSVELNAFPALEAIDNIFLLTIDF